MKMKYSNLLVSGLALATFAITTVSADDKGVANGGRLTITKDFSLTNGVLSPNTMFTFNVSQGQPANQSEVKNGLHVYAGEMDGLTNTATVTYDNNSTTTNKTKEGNIDFSVVNYDKPGIYRYTITEQQGDVPGVTYDAKKYTVDVYVLTQDDGTCKPQYIESKVNGEDSKKPVKFDNKIQTTSLKVTKKVTGNAGDRNKDFTFSIKLEDNSGKGLYKSGKVSMTITKKDNSKTQVEVDLGTAKLFELKDGESATIDKLPQGIQYFVTETNDDGCKQSATVNKDTSTTTTAPEEYTLGKGVTSDNTPDEIVVTNTKNSTTPTGVAMTIAPYVGLTILALGGVLYVFKKRKA